MKSYLVNIIFFLLFFIGCSNNSSNNNSDTTATEDLPEISIDSSRQHNSKTEYRYDLKNPERTWILPSSLEEVSGNTWVDKNHLLLIDDRHPNLYLVKIDGKNVVLEKTISFQKMRKTSLI